MELSPAILKLLSELDSLSGGTLARRTDLGALLEAGRAGPLRDLLDELSFYGKFLHRTQGIMTRIGPSGEGYERLAREFSDASARASALIVRLAAALPDDVRQRLTATYLALTPDGLANLLALCRDLSWYKNLLIDTRRTREKGT